MLLLMCCWRGVMQSCGCTSISDAPQQLHRGEMPTLLSCTSELQSWHRPRTQGISPEPTDQLVVRKPKAPGHSCVKSTLYRAYAGPLPDPVVLSVGDELRDLRPQPGICKIVCDLADLTLVDSNGFIQSHTLYIHLISFHNIYFIFPFMRLLSL